MLHAITTCPSKFCYMLSGLVIQLCINIISDAITDGSVAYILERTLSIFHYEGPN